MWKRLFNGLVFGAGFAVAFFTVGIVAIYFVLPGIIVNRMQSGSITQNEIAEAPAVEKSGRFLGTSGAYNRGFLNNRSSILSGGPGQITGNASVNSESVEGLKLRLALNGSVMSQWAMTGSDGRYEISVPYGEYRIDGFELDQPTADKVLANKINHPQMMNSSDVFKVSRDNTGRGLDFKFVDPVIKSLKKRKYSVSDKVVLEWLPYPNAVEYSVQVYEKDDPYAWSNNTLFEWPNRPEVSEPKISLREFGVQLKPGKFYSFEVQAKGQQKRILSETASRHSGYDFEVSE